MNDAADQPMIEEILRNYLDPEDMPGGSDQFEEMLAELKKRDNIMQTDSYDLGKYHAFKKIRSVAQEGIDKVSNN